MTIKTFISRFSYKIIFSRRMSQYRLDIPYAENLLESYPETRRWFKNIQKNHNGAKFFKYHDTNFKTFWNHFTFNEIMAMATIDEYAAYTILQENYAGFRTFCELAWDCSILDLKTADIRTAEEFEFIYKMFPKSKAIILPEDIFPDILHHLSQFTDISVHLSKDSIIKHAYHPYKVNTLRIFGPFSGGDTVIAPIFDTFTDFDRVEIHRANFTANIFEQFFCRSPKCLVISDMDIDWCDEIKMARNILKLKKLEELTIEYSESRNNNTQETIEFLLQRIHLLNNLKILRINLELTQQNIIRLKKIRNIDVKVYTFLGHREPSLLEAYDIFKGTKIEIIDVSPEIEPDIYGYTLTPGRMAEQEEQWEMERFLNEDLGHGQILQEDEPEEFHLEFQWNEH